MVPASRIRSAVTNSKNGCGESFAPAGSSPSRNVAPTTLRQYMLVRTVTFRHVLGWVLLVLISTANLSFAQTKRKSPVLLTPPERGTSALTVELVPVADSPQMRALTPERGTLDLGSVSLTANSEPRVQVRRGARSLIVTSEFGLRVKGDPGQKLPVTIRSFVTHSSSVQRFRVNGQLLSSSPVIIAKNVVVGTVTRNRLEVEIPYSSTESEGNVNVSLGFSVTTN